MKFRQIKKVAAMVLTVSLFLGSSFTSYGAGWQQDAFGWWYEKEDGTFPVNTWYEDEDGSWYFFDEQGYMITNCYRLIDGSFYNFGNDGRWGGLVFSDLYPGVWNGNNYSNEWSGFHLNVPAGYQIETAADTKTIGSAQTFVEFVVRTPDGTSSGIELEYADAYDFSNGAATTPEYVVTWHSVLLSLMGYTVESVSTVNLGGKTYLKLSTDGAGMAKRELYCRKVGDHYFECMTVIYWLASQPYVEGLLAGIY